MTSPGDSAGNDVTYADFVERLVAAIPELAAELDEHVETFGQVLPHIFMGQLAALVPEQLEGGEADTAVAHRVLDSLEQAMASPDPKVSEAIVVSFLETLDSEDEAGTVESMLGPRLREALEGVRRG